MSELNPLYYKRTSCRGCYARSLRSMWDLGMQQIVDFPRQPGGVTRGKAPLELVRCDECKLVQLAHTVNGAALFTDAFWYRSGINESMIRALGDIVEEAQSLVALRPGDAVLDIGSNDGTLLSLYKTDDIVKVGIDPSPVEPREGVVYTVIRDYFSAEAVRSVAPLYKIITAIAMVYDLDDPRGFLSDIDRILAPGGICVVQMNSLTGMLSRMAFDNICHEHLTYFTLETFLNLVHSVGFVAKAVSVNGVNGGSIRVVLARKTEAEEDRTTVDKFLKAEEAFGANTEAALVKFRQKIDVARAETKAQLATVPPDCPIYVYGASTRGSTLMQYFDFPRGTFAGAAERDERKFGRFYLDTDIEIVDEETARKQAKVFFVLPWHFLQSILEREFAWIDNGGRVFAPLPTPRWY